MPNNAKRSMHLVKAREVHRSSQWNPNRVPGVLRIGLLMNCVQVEWIEPSVPSAEFIQLQHTLFTIEIAKPHSLHTPSTWAKFIKVSCGAIITIPSYFSNPFIYSGTCAWFAIHFGYRDFVIYRFAPVVMSIMHATSPGRGCHGTCNTSCFPNGLSGGQLMLKAPVAQWCKIIEGWTGLVKSFL